MQCDDDCGDCCGPAPCSEEEFVRIGAYAEKHNIEPKRQGGKCPWYQGGKCTVHEVRPAICRAFGHFRNLVCSRGYNVNLPSGSLKRRWQSKLKGERLLHEIFDDGLEYLKRYYPEIHAEWQVIHKMQLAREPEGSDEHGSSRDLER